MRPVTASLTSRLGHTKGSVCIFKKCQFTEQALTRVSFCATPIVPQVKVVNVTGIDYDLDEPAACDKMTLNYAQIAICESVQHAYSCSQGSSGPAASVPGVACWEAGHATDYLRSHSLTRALAPAAAPQTSTCA
jgi:hypothetical protein